jgi:hypothetical protein
MDAVWIRNEDRLWLTVYEADFADDVSVLTTSRAGLERVSELCVPFDIEVNFLKTAYLALNAERKWTTVGDDMQSATLASGS